jgi:hypothetical protein
LSYTIEEAFYARVRDLLSVMAKCGEHEHFYNFIVNLVDESMFFGDSSGIYRAIVALKLFHLTSSRPGVFPDFIKEL